jgi:FAD/FMN-containing dehydrogenase
MVDIITLDGALTSVGAAEITTLRDKLRGRVILVDDADYDNARRVWNGNVDRRPALIARCVDTTDVHHAVNFARSRCWRQCPRWWRGRRLSRGLLLAVRGGGHSAPGYGTNNGGVVIDLSPMKAISINQTTRTARAEGGHRRSDPRRRPGLAHGQARR